MGSRRRSEVGVKISLATIIDLRRDLVERFQFRLRWRVPTAFERGRVGNGAVFGGLRAFRPSSAKLQQASDARAAEEPKSTLRTRRAARACKRAGDGRATLVAAVLHVDSKSFELAFGCETGDVDRKVRLINSMQRATRRSVR
jgi:hypothetical protein